MIFSDIAAVILAGGKNSRLNYEKSLLQVENDYFIQHQIKLLKKIFAEVIVVTEKEELRSLCQNVKFAADNFVDCGPVGGIEAAMAEYDFKDYFVFACDMPFLNTEIIRQMISEHNNSEADVTLPEHDEGIEPLHAIYKRNALQYLQKNIRAGKYQVRKIFPYLEVNYLGFSKKQLRYFFNINTPKDLQKFSQMADSKRLSKRFSNSLVIGE